MIISFTGAQSTGKTTLLNKCKPLYSYQFNFIDEVTRRVKKEYKVEINEQGDNVTQLLILNDHLQNMVKHRYDNVIMDRCIIDGVIYTCWLHDNGRVDKWVMDYACELFNELIDRVDVIFYCEPEFDAVDDGERSVDKQFRDEIIGHFEDVVENVHSLKGKVIRLKGSIEERMKMIDDTIKSKIS